MIDNNYLAPPSTSTPKTSKRMSTQSSATARTSSAVSTKSSFKSLFHPLRAKISPSTTSFFSSQSHSTQYQLPDYAEMLDEDNSAWGVPSSSKRQRQRKTSRS